VKCICFLKELFKRDEYIKRCEKKTTIPHSTYPMDTFNSFLPFIKSKIQGIFHFFGFEFSRFPRKVTLSKRDAHFIQLLREFKIDLILDVGAANGGYGDWIRSLGYNKRVISFEPLQVSFEELRKKTDQDALLLLK